MPGKLRLSRDTIHVEICPLKVNITSKPLQNIDW
jgi:hypothetical protein